MSPTITVISRTATVSQKSKRRSADRPGVDVNMKSAVRDRIAACVSLNNYTVTQKKHVTLFI